MIGTRENDDFLLIFTKAKTQQYKVDETKYSGFFPRCHSKQFSNLSFYRE